jgi:RNA-directed DNA polymerase
MALHTQLPIYKVAYDLLDVVADLVKNMPRDVKRTFGNEIANVLLDRLDQYVKHTMHTRHYIRYVDDMVLLSDRAPDLVAAHTAIAAWLPATLGLALNPRKTILQPIDRGIDFVGQVIKPWSRRTRRTTLHVALHRTAVSAPADRYQTANSYFGLLRQATHSHTDRARLANVFRHCGHCVAGNLTKTYRKGTP